MNGTHKLSANLPLETMALLRELSAERHCTITEALRTALVTEKYIRDVLKNGGKMLVELPDGRVHEVIFR